MTDTPTQPPAHTPDSEHAWVNEAMGAYVAGGLEAVERERFDRHINACPECFDAFTEARDADRAMQRALGGLAPGEKFVERIVHHVREATMKRWMHPMVKRAGYGIAAAVALAATGVLGNYALRQDGGLNNPLSQMLLSKADEASPGWTDSMDLASRFKTRYLRQMIAEDSPPAPGAAMAVHWTDTPVDTVLDQMSKGFGFTVIKQKPIPGRITMNSAEPISTSQAISLLNDTLVPLGYTALTSYTTDESHQTILRVVSASEAKKSQIPVRSGANPADIPLNDELVTQVIPLKTLDAVRLRSDLRPILSADADVAANEGSNSLVVTDTSAKVHRLAEIISSMDTQTVLQNDLHQKQLKTAKAGDAAKLVNDVFNSGNSGIAGGGAGIPGGSSAGAEGLQRLGKVFASSDTRTNTVVVTGPPEQVKAAMKMLDDVDNSTVVASADTYRTGLSLQSHNLIVGNVSGKLASGRTEDEAEKRVRSDPAAAGVTAALPYSTSNEPRQSAGERGEPALGRAYAVEGDYKNAVAKSTDTVVDGGALFAWNLQNGPANKAAGAEHYYGGYVGQNAEGKSLFGLEAGKGLEQRGVQGTALAYNYQKVTELTTAGEGRQSSERELAEAGRAPVALQGENRFVGGSTVAGNTLSVNAGTPLKAIGEQPGKERVRAGDDVGLSAGHAELARAPDVAVATPVAPAATGPSTPPTTQAAGAPGVQEIAVRKIIRNGEVQFEVRSFDDTYVTVATVVQEEGGYVSSTSSEKLANGKVRGTIVVRVPPERLDRLLLKLRALGDLKSQQISASDVTKQYTDLESELRALRAMESRLLDLIKNGKGEVKDLVEAEKQLGVYRVRIEQIEGEIRYYNNLVGMATLSITAFEKDIQTPTAASEQENVTLNLETEDVETKYADARKVLEDAKGRIIESELKKMDADQFAARIVAEVPPDRADFVAAQLRQLGKAAVFNRDRKQTTTGGVGVPGVQVERKDTRFTIALYNLANIAPRETAVLTVAVGNVEDVYKKVVGLVNAPAAPPPPPPAGGAAAPAGGAEAKPVGRIVSSALTGQQPEQMTADLRADLRTESADAVLSAIRGSGEVLSGSVAVNPDTANVTSAKRGLQLKLVNVAAVAPRETQTIKAVAADVPAAYRALLGPTGSLKKLADAGRGRVLTSQLSESDPQSVNATLIFEAKRDATDDVDNALKAAGIEFLSRDVMRSTDTVNTLDTKVLYRVASLTSAEAMRPRRTIVLGLEVEDVGKALEAMKPQTGGGVKEVDYSLAKDASGRVTGRITLEMTPTATMEVLGKVTALGGVEKVNQVVKDSSVPEMRLSKDRIELTLTNKEALVETGHGVGSSMRAALSTALAALLYSLYLVITGVLFVGPWVLIGWLVWKVFRRRKAAAA